MYATCSRRRRRAASPLQGANYVGTCVDVSCVRPSQPLSPLVHTILYIFDVTHTPLHAWRREWVRERDGWMMLFVPIAFTGLTSYFRYSGYKLPTCQTGIWAADRGRHTPRLQPACVRELCCTHAPQTCRLCHTSASDSQIFPLRYILTARVQIEWEKMKFGCSYCAQKYLLIVGN